LQCPPRNVIDFFILENYNIDDACKEKINLKSFTFNTEEVCSKSIKFDIDGDIVRNVKFIGGCPGNLQAISCLVEELPIDKIIEKLSGIKCGNKGTSCPDQFAKALKSVLVESRSVMNSK